MWASTESNPSPIVATETWVPPASRHPWISAVSSSMFDPLNATYSPPKSSADLPALATRSRSAFHTPTAGRRATDEDESVGQACCPFVCRLAGAAEPDRDGTRRLGQECRPVDPVEAAREVHDRLREQLAKQLDLFLLPGTPGCEVLPERLVLDVAPADADSEPQAATREQIDIGGLACDECCLALREDQNPGREADSLGDASQVAEHDERVMERVTLVVRAGQLRRSISVNGTQHVVVSEKMVEPRSSTALPNLRTALGSPRSSVCG